MKYDELVVIYVTTSSLGIVWFLSMMDTDIENWQVVDHPCNDGPASWTLLHYLTTIPLLLYVVAVVHPQLLVLASHW